MERIYELEKEHAYLYDELLKALDRLYLLKQGTAPETNETEMILQTRRQLQRGLNQSAALLRTIERASQSSNENLIDNSTEFLLAKQLLNVMQENYDIDCDIKSFLTKEDEYTAELREERKQYEGLVRKYKESSVILNDCFKKTHVSNSGPNNSEGDVPDSQIDDGTLVADNEVLYQLLIALKIHAGYDLFS